LFAFFSLGGLQGLYVATFSHYRSLVVNVKANFYFCKKGFFCVIIAVFQVVSWQKSTFFNFPQKLVLT